MHTYFDESRLQYVRLSLPKFRILSQYDFVKTFIHFGVTDIFDPKHSNFGMMTNDSVFVRSLLQASNIVVDELGVTTTAATEFRPEKSQSRPIEFNVKKPFLFLIYSASAKLVIFSAVVSNPNSA
ncbi:Heparin cofactor 2 [Thelohanellus kitauei]|uniref:Heparin cofactor 2 n=1 Tax=Thelohanellus kitauei TaxID=669202 RepID=A0A0C2J7X8_THEKT|nr:Heparin cofactor 2 [Thelohanellus kitauei]